jgi:hypothetical protein
LTAISQSVAQYGSKGELEKALGVKKLNAQDLKTRLKHLMGSVVEVPDNSTKRGFKLVTLFEEAVAEQDENGLWQVSLECTQKSMKYFFNIENLGYLRYNSAVSHLSHPDTHMSCSFIWNPIDTGDRGKCRSMS